MREKQHIIYKKLYFAKHYFLFKKIHRSNGSLWNKYSSNIFIIKGHSRNLFKAYRSSVKYSFAPHGNTKEKLQVSFSEVEPLNYRKLLKQNSPLLLRCSTRGMKDSAVRSEFVTHCKSTMENGLRDKVLQPDRLSWKIAKRKRNHPDNFATESMKNGCLLG